jgi:Cu+-exporting ATPase
MGRAVAGTAYAFLTGNSSHMEVVMTQVTDPVCGMKVDANSPIQATVDGHTYHFCSEACRTRFEASPAQYRASADGEAGGAHGERHEPPHTVTGGFPAPKFGFAGSGGAEYEQLPERHGSEHDKH